MYTNYLKIAYRNLLRNKAYSLINIGGLAMGLAVAMLIGLWIHAELSFNEVHRNHGQIAQVMQHRIADGNIETTAAIPIPLEHELSAKYGSDLERLVTAFWPQEQVLSFEHKSFTKLGNYMVKEAISLFSVEMLKGASDGLADPNSIILSESTAKMIFAEEEAMGKPMKINNEMEVMVTGVYKDFSKNSSLYGLAFIAPWELFVSSEEWVRNAQATNNWDINAFQLFVQLTEQAEATAVGEKIRLIAHEQVVGAEAGRQSELFLHPMDDWHLRSRWEDGVNTGGRIQFVWLFGLIGAFVLILACINFMNLSTAQSEKRSREVGIRKSIGSGRSQLIQQFLLESFLVVLLSSILAIGMVILALPAFNALTDKHILLPFASMSFWLIMMGFVGLTGLLAGSYPALYLSAFQPIKVLKGSFQAGRSASIFRKGLVVLQFTVSVTLIISTLVVQQQIQFTKDRPMGYDPSHTIMIWSNSPDFIGQFDLLRTALKSRQAILEMSQASSPLTNVFSHDDNLQWEGKDPNTRVNFATIRVTHDYGKTTSWQITDGRDFSIAYASDSSACILNKTAVDYMARRDPIGKMIVQRQGESVRKLKVIGVINDILRVSPFQSIEPTIYTIANHHLDCMAIKLNPSKSTEEALAIIKTVFSEYLPAIPFDYRFVDQEHELKFSAEKRIGSLSGFFAGLAIFISCLGLFGLASFVAEQRTKEIGIRKVLGASIYTIWKMISSDFVGLVFLACLVASPISYYALGRWLQHFEYRTTIPWWTFLVSCGGVILICLLTVSFRTIRAASRNPLQSLTSE